MAAMELIRGDEPAKEIEFSESDDYYIDESFIFFLMRFIY